MFVTAFTEEISEQNSTDTELADTISEYLAQKEEKTPEPEIIENKIQQQDEVEVLKEITEHFNDLQATVPKKAEAEEEESLKTPPPSPADENNVEEKCDISKGKNIIYCAQKWNSSKFLH